MTDDLAALLRYGHHDETCASMYAPALERPCNCGFLELLSRLDPPDERYRDALASGLSDSEAREEGWPATLQTPSDEGPRADRAVIREAFIHIAEAEYPTAYRSLIGVLDAALAAAALSRPAPAPDPETDEWGRTAEMVAFQNLMDEGDDE